MRISQFSKSIPYLVFCAFVLLSSCGENESVMGEELLSVVTAVPSDPVEEAGDPVVTPPGSQTYGNAHYAMWPYLEVFEKEAKYRSYYADIHTCGIDINLGLLAPELSKYTDDASVDMPTLLIDKSFWVDASDGEREVVLFNALGHYFLEKNFDNDETSNGICLSLMRDDSATCADNYNSNTKDNYLDELFQ